MKRICWMLSILIGISAFAQDGPGISETFTVSAATVEVVVEDKKGNRIENLSREDFQLAVNGMNAPLTFFTEVRNQPADTVAEDEYHVLPSETVPRNYLVFVDDYFTLRQYRIKLFKNLLKNVDAMRPIDRMAIVRFKGKGLELISPWTSDREDLYDTLKDVSKKVPGEMARRTRLSMQTTDGKAVEAYRQVSQVVGAVEASMRSMPPVDGRKILLLMTSGWPYSYRKMANEGELASDRIRNNTTLDASISSLPTFRGGGLHTLDPITDTANLLSYTVYPMLLGTVNSGEFAGSGGATFADFSQGLGFETSYDGMKHVADKTGGSMINKAQFAKLPLTDVANDQHGYYTLGFSTSDLKIGDRHQIEVTIRGMDYKVRHRQDFRHRTPAENADLEAQAAVFTGNTPNDLEVTLGPPQKQKGRKMLLPFSINIPTDWLALQRSGEKYQAKMTLRVTSEDKGGYQADVVRAPIELSGNKPEPGSSTVYNAAIMVRKKKQRLVFTLADNLGGSTKSTTLDFAP